MNTKINASVPLYRASSNVQIGDFLSTFGRFKEVRLTATLAYLVSQLPHQFKETLKIEKRDKIIDVKVEYSSEKDRYDILILTRKKLIVVEAKKGLEQNILQIKKYLRSFKKQNRRISLVLLDRGSYISSSRINAIKKRFSSRLKVDYIEWKNIHRVIKKIVKSKRIKKDSPVPYIIANEMKKYMEAEHMTSDELKEVYCRDLSGDSLILFFKYHIYKCQNKFLKSAKGNHYFAPYFTRKAKDSSKETMMIDVGEGISYVAPILDMREVYRNEVREYLESQEHPLAKDAAKEILRQARQREILVLRLGEPQRVFLTPITKRRLGRGVGATGSKSFTFGALFEALNKDR